MAYFKDFKMVFGGFVVGFYMGFRWFLRGLGLSFSRVNGAVFILALKHCSYTSSF